MSSLRILLAASGAVLVAAACSPYNPDLGQTPFKCGASEPKCPDDYECVPDTSSAQGVCKALNQVPGADGGVIGSDGGGNVVCNDDAEIEPNDSTADPTIIPIPDFGDTYQLVNLAICPQTDLDVFRFRVDVMNKNAKVEVSYNSGAGLLVLDILNTNGLSITQGAPANGNNDVLRAVVNNLPVGNYYAQVQSAGGTQNNYQIDFALTGP